jgi:hypothetical protein
MRVWIISDKRYGDRCEEHWIAEVCHDPRPDADPAESLWDRVVERCYRCTTREKALALAATLKSNVMNAAQVYKRTLEHMDGHVYDWSVASEPEEVECIYDPSPQTEKA